MTDWTGRFLDPAVSKTEAHERAQTDAEKELHPLPQTVTYEVAREHGKEILSSVRKTTRSRATSGDSSTSEQETSSAKDDWRFVLNSMGGNTLRRPTLASVTYMDVGCWGGSAPDDKNTTAHWKKQRYFGIVYESLAVLCAYKPWKYSEDGPTLKEAKTVPSRFDFKTNAQYEKIRPLLQALSTDPKLGPVVVLRVVLNKQPGVEPPSDNRIHVVLGDLHAPVMTEQEATYVGRPRPKSSSRPGTDQSRSTSTSTGLPQTQASYSSPADGTGQSRSVSTSTGLGATSPAQVLTAGRAVAGDYRTSTDPGSSGHLSSSPPASPVRDDRSTSVDPGIGGTQYPLKGRYDRGAVAKALVPILSRILGEGASVVARPGNVLVKVAETALVGAGAIVHLPRLLAGTAAGMGDIVTSIGLDRWSDDDGVSASVVEDWFARYHGAGNLAGADVFDDAGADLLAWLKMLAAYQSAGGGQLPIKLIQVGDLFDFWIGLKCPFSLTGGARTFPNPDAAKRFVQYWLAESLKNEAIRALWHFAAAPKVLLHGNHDTYMGSAQLVADPLPSKFVDKGLIVEHGHKDDPFNKEDSAALGYLLTQAVFVDNHVRLLENNMSAVKTMAIGGLWTRLGYNESAVMACVRDRIAHDEPIASTFVMGHTHEPTLQRIDIVECADSSKETSTATGLGAPPSASVKPLGKGESQSTQTSTATGLPAGPSASSSKGTDCDRRTSILTRIPVPAETPIPPALQWYRSGK